MHIGPQQLAGGRLDEPAANELSDSLRQIGLELKRLKTGTPARLDAATVDLDKLEVQRGDDKPVAFSFMTESIDRPQICTLRRFIPDRLLPPAQGTARALRPR